MEKIIINRIFDEPQFKILPLKRKRYWMDQTDQSYAYRCMPLSIANEYGWAALSPSQFSVTWDGSDDLSGVSVEYGDQNHNGFVQSHFGSGIVTISVDFVIQTPENTSLYVRGIPNETIDGLQPLDAIIETDWLPFTFTYNYKFTRPCTVRFEKDEALFSFFPIRRNEINNYKIISQDISSNKIFFQQYLEYSENRRKYLMGEHKNMSSSGQKYYTNAKDPQGNKYRVKNHLKKIAINPPEVL